MTVKLSERGRTAIRLLRSVAVRHDLTDSGGAGTGGGLYRSKMGSGADLQVQAGVSLGIS
jgi:hypothetical protein